MTRLEWGIAVWLGGVFTFVFLPLELLAHYWRRCPWPTLSGTFWIGIHDWPALAAAYPDNYSGFTCYPNCTVFLFTMSSPDDLEATIAPIVASTQSKALANLFQTLANNTALDQTTRETCAQAAAELDPSS